MNIETIYATIVFILKKCDKLTEAEAASFMTELRYKPLHPTYDGLLKQLEESYSKIKNEEKNSEDSTQGISEGTRTPEESISERNERAEEERGSQTVGRGEERIEEKIDVKNSATTEADFS
jgi:hypothetical protein